MKIKDRRSAAAQLMKLRPGPLTPCDLGTMSKIPSGMTRAFRNNRYTVMIFDNQKTTKGPAIQVLIQQLDDRPIAGHWREIQNIKNEIFGPEVVGIEYYPAESNLLDTYNLYWLWIFPADVIPHFLLK